MSKLEFRTLTTADLLQMHLAFNEAFSQYSVNMNMSMEAFNQRMLNKLNINFDLSPAAFDGDKMIGFIFHSFNEYEGKSTAYNGGTGVLPKYWGQQITKQLHDFIIPKLKKEGIERCLLEVIKSNEQAINAYKKTGFSISKPYKCFKLTNNLMPDGKGSNFNIQIQSRPNWDTYNGLSTTLPSMLDSSKQLICNLKNETVLEALFENKIVAYAIFQSKLGRISQIAVGEKHRRQGIGIALVNKIYELSTVKNLTVINVEESEQSVVSFLEMLGFENQINQWEMELII